MPSAAPTGVGNVRWCRQWSQASITSRASHGSVPTHVLEGWTAERNACCAVVLAVCSTVPARRAVVCPLAVSSLPAVYHRNTRLMQRGRQQSVGATGLAWQCTTTTLRQGSSARGTLEGQRPLLLVGRHTTNCLHAAFVALVLGCCFPDPPALHCGSAWNPTCAHRKHQAGKKALLMHQGQRHVCAEPTPPLAAYPQRIVPESECGVPQGASWPTTWGWARRCRPSR
jgi:hypothetical protein